MNHLEVAASIKSGNAALSYRPDIDGLRAFAVLVVVLYHAGLPFFPGGYVGVDVFFVISGFLITRLIVKEVDTAGGLSFRRFYVRRVRRLFPAFVSTALFSAGAAAILFPPEEMARFAGSLVFAALSSSNFFFWTESGYFDADASVKPLLHTWSLSVEEQFYLIWPALFSALWLRKRKWALRVVLGGCFVSLLTAEVLLSVDPSAAYFLLPPRAVELGIGAALALLPCPTTVTRHRSLALVCGLCLIASAVFFFDSNTRFPGISALVPCLGAALVIWAGDATGRVRLLTNKPAVWLGKASYSIYLVHWPIIVFFHVYSFRPPSLWESAALVIVSIALGFAQYYFIEERFRHGSLLPLAFRAGLAVCLAAMIIPSAAIWQTGGAQWRIPAERQALTNGQWRVKEIREYCEAWSPNLPRDIFTCQNYRGSDHDIIIWGDSHARHLVAGFSETFPEHNISVVHLNGCVPQSGFGGYEPPGECTDRNLKAIDLLKSIRPAVVVLNSAKRGSAEEMAQPINSLLSELEELGHTPVYLADFIRPDVELAACGNVPKVLITQEHLIQRCVGNSTVAQKELAYNRALSGLVPNFVDIRDAQCPADNCLYFAEGAPLYRDSHHLTTHGSIYFMKKLRRELSRHIREVS